MLDKELSHNIIGAAIEIHRTLGPGLLEAVYEECLARELTIRCVPFERQKPIPLVYEDLKLECGYRLDFLVSGLRLSGVPLGLLINFNVPILKDGLRRYVWHYQETDNAETLSDAETRGEEARQLGKAKTAV
jgi:PD-(D/E)XK nuclease superfamily